MGYSQAQRQRLFEIIEEVTGCYVKETQDPELGRVFLLFEPSGELQGDPFDYFEDLWDYVSENREVDRISRADDVLNPVLIEERAWVAKNDPNREYSYMAGV